MRTSSWLTVVCCIAASSGCPVPGTGANQGGAGSGSNQTGAANCKQYLFPPPEKPTPILAITCPRKVCGLNGSWLGQGVPFRTLHLHGAANPEGQAILEVDDAGGHPMTIDLEGDVLTGRSPSGRSFTGSALNGWSLVLGPPGGPPRYRLTIEVLAPAQAFWAQCPTCSAPVRAAVEYQFSAQSLTDSCKIAVCDPSLTNDPGTGINGIAAIFRGDYYDDASFVVSDQPSTANANSDGDLFNIACRGTAIHKLYMLRHTRASASDRTAVTTPAQRTAMLRLLAGDYCGTGQSFTRNGVPIQLGTNPASSPYQVTAASGYDLADAGTIDARWTEAGASCIDTPRVERFPELAPLLAELRATCPRPTCATAAPGSWDAVSANPR